MEDDFEANESEEIEIEEAPQWNITYESESKYWKEHLIGIYTYAPKRCPNCKN